MGKVNVFPYDDKKMHEYYEKFLKIKEEQEHHIIKETK